MEKPTVLQLTSDFECGSGRLKPLGPDHWRLDTVGDRFGYNRYFCVHVENTDTTTARTLRLEIYPDPDLGPASHFMSHFPSHLWYSEGGWVRWTPVRHTWEDAVTFFDDRIELRVSVRPGGSLDLATNAPLRYSDLLAWVARMKERFGDRLRLESIGRSYEGRDIPVLRLGAAEGGPSRKRLRLLVLAGMHNSEHSGVWASQGIVEYLCSGIAEAREIADGFDLAILPMLNPDGNVHGYSGGTAERLSVNNSLDFSGVSGEQGDSAGVSPQTHENRLLWAWLGERFQPDYLLHFHGYMGWRRNADHPYDGLYGLPDPASHYRDPARGRAYRAILDRMLFDTPAYSAHWGTTGTLEEATLEHHLARRFQTVGVLYEINVGSVGPSEQFRRGPQVLTAFTRALLRDLPPAAYG